MRMSVAEPAERPANARFGRDGRLASRGAWGAWGAFSASVIVTRNLRQSSVKNGGGLILADEPTTVQSGF
jgi:hypothetical protein